MAGEQRGSIIGALIFGPIAMIVGFLVAYFVGLPMIREAQASKNWPTAEGVITVSKVESEHRDGERSYSHHVEYRYTINGQQFTGDRVWASDNFSSNMSSFAKKIVARYPVNKEVKVYYNPEMPATCMLEPGTTWTTYLPVGIGGLFCLIGLLVTGGLVLKLIAGIFFFGAAATSHVTDSSQSASSTSDPLPGPSHSSGNDDDGIDIG